MDFKYYIFGGLSFIVLLFLNLLEESNKKSTRTIAHIGLLTYFIIFYIFIYQNKGLSLVFLLENPLIIGILVSVILVGFVKIYTLIRNLRAKKNKKGIERDIDVDYSPAVLSCLLRQDISYKDLIADIMNLYAKKVINFYKKENNKIIFYLKDQNRKIKVSESDNYIIETLIDDNNKMKFNFDVWKECVKREYKKYGFSNINLREMLTLKSLSILVVDIGIIGAIIELLKMKSLGWCFIGLISGMIIGTLIVCYLLGFADSQSNSNMFLSKKGKRELEKWMGIKEFMEKYTLIKERSFEEITLYESYIPYAIPLGINTRYKDTKFDIFDIDEIESIISENKATTLLERLGIYV